MALQGNLRDFSASEILQLAGTQKKTGCLSLERDGVPSVIWVQEGRIVSTRPLATVESDPLLTFLRTTHRLSEEQLLGLLSIQRESARDLEDLLVNGRYLDEQELASYLERMILEEVTRVVRWQSGTYRFDPNASWPHPPLVMLSMEGVVIEAARRIDEQKRFGALFQDPRQILSVRDLPDPDVPVSEEERELFGIIDGRRTIAEVLEASPLSEYECQEALHRMLESQWIEFVGRQAPGPVQPVAVAADTPARRHDSPLVRELAVVLAALVLVLGLRAASSALGMDRVHAPHTDAYAAAQVRDLRYALDLYARENGHYPARLSILSEDRWISADQLALRGYTLTYQADAGGQRCRVAIAPAR